MQYYTYHKSKIIHSLLTGAKKLPAVLKKLIVPINNLHKHNTRKQNTIYEVKPRRPIGNRLLKCNASRGWNRLPTKVTQQLVALFVLNDILDLVNC